MSNFDDEIAERLGSLLICVEQNDRYFNLIESIYPLGLNRIAWSEAGCVAHLNLHNVTEKEKYINDFFEQVFGFILNAAEEMVVIWGDGAIDRAYRIEFVNLKSVCHLFFELPQHTYVWFELTKKLLNYTFEDELFFG